MFLNSQAFFADSLEILHLLYWMNFSIFWKDICDLKVLIIIQVTSQQKENIIAY